MTLPSADISWNVFANRELTNSQTWYSRILTFLNGLRDNAQVYSVYWKSECTTPRSITNATWTRIQLTNILIDPLNIGLDATGGFVAPIAGVYQCIGSAGVTVTSGRKGCQVIKNGAAGGTPNLDGTQRLFTAPSATEGIVSGTVFAQLAAGDRLNVYGFQETGGAVNTVESTVSERSSLTVVRVA